MINSYVVCFTDCDILAVNVIVENAAYHLFSVFKRSMETLVGIGTYLNDATYEHVITLMVNPVLQHHFIHHGDEDLVLKITGQPKQVNKRVDDCLMWFSLAGSFPSTYGKCKALVPNHQECLIKSLTFGSRSSCMRACGFFEVA